MNLSQQQQKIPPYHQPFPMSTPKFPPPATAKFLQTRRSQCAAPFASAVAGFDGSSGLSLCSGRFGRFGRSWHGNSYLIERLGGKVKLLNDLASRKGNFMLKVAQNSYRRLKPSDPLPASLQDFQGQPLFAKQLERHGGYSASPDLAWSCGFFARWRTR